MARNHFKYVVRDAYGYAIQNAKVNIYQPGTTTDFTGSAFDAASAGSAATNPFTTNDQGEVEAWFDTEQDVDVQVDDNSNAAYRAVEGVSGAFSFATFTEKDTIYDAPDNLIADLAAKAATPHGAADHTNITRSFFLEVLDVVNDGGTVATRGTAPDALRVVTLADAASTGMSWVFAVPDDWASGALSCEIFHAGQTTSGGVVRWSIDSQDIAEGASIVGAGTSAAFTGATIATADLLIIEAAQALETPAAAGDLFRVSVRRLGSDGADSYAASTSLIGIRISYTATQ